ncbi:putative response regulator receiver modulated diguanylate cyclase/phosphodiesterase with PAS/PAC sensor [Roseibium sp. TrichSKD4]|nr:putative response regulator receiver modulated diguanylate cyclase/phosphodiesterase with PAS/PAC sensor [Roseibium sp. TrichSKD4]
MRPQRSTAAFASSYASGFLHGGGAPQMNKALTDPDNLDVVVGLRETLAQPTSRAEFIDLIAPLVQNADRSPCTLMVMGIDFTHHLYEPIAPNPPTEQIAFVADKLIETLPRGTVVGHTGLYEFAVLLRDGGSSSSITPLCAELLRKTLSKTTQTDALVGISTSIGWASSPSDGQSAETLMEQAAKALTQARQDGGNCALAAHTFNAAATEASVQERTKKVG